MEETQMNTDEMSITELLEWRAHDSHCEITHTGWGPYMVERVSNDRARVWLPDEAKAARLVLDGLSSVDEAKAFVQRDVDGRRTLKFLAEAETAFDSAPEPEDADIEASVQRMRSTLNATIAKAASPLPTQSRTPPNDDRLEAD